MIEFLESLFGKTVGGKKIFEMAGIPQPDLKIVAIPVRKGKNAENYVFDNVAKFPSIIEKWRFEPKDAFELGICGYDYHILFMNGKVNISISVCFLCNTLVVNDPEKHTTSNYTTSKKQLMALLREDFRLL